MESPERLTQRYFFVHIMKTGGTALVQGFRNHFGDAVYPTAGLDGPDLWELYLLPDRLREQLSERGDEIRLVAGHFPLCTTELLAGRFTTITLLREPVERVLSFLRSMRCDSLEQAHDELVTQTLPTMRGHPALDPTNNMTRMLSITPEEMRRAGAKSVPMTTDHLARAKEALMGLDAIGVQERFEEFRRQLATRFGWDLGDPGRINATRSSEASESLRARVAEDNALDIELYEFASRLIRESEGS